jgi:RNA polymerase sigma-70 factor (ECF subfamily)
MGPSKESEAAEKLLIESARSGNSEAFSELVRLHSTRVYNTSLRILNNKADAEDNLQNVWCRVHRYIHRFQGRSRFATWLVSITINEALMKLRKGRRERATLQAAGPPPNAKHLALEMEDAHSDPERLYVTKELAVKALQGLQPSLVEMFTRHKAEGWTQRELAREMGVTVAAVKSRIFHARARMQTQLHTLC